MQKAAFLDRDGVINERVAIHDYIRKWEDFRFLGQAAEAIALLNRSGYLVVLVSNQRGVARGLLTMDTVDAIHRNMRAELARRGARIDGIYVCPHDVGECRCRKPDIGLFLQAEREFEIDKTASWMVGDEETDVEAGRNYGVRTILIGERRQSGCDMLCANLMEAARYIVSEGRVN